MGPQEILDILDKGWLALLPFFVRWIWLERKAKRNDNGNRRRLSDKLPGNPGHSHYELLEAKINDLKLDVTDDIKRVEKIASENSNRIYELIKCVSAIEGELGIKK